MFLIVNYSKSKINVILTASRIAVIVLFLQAACRRFSPDQGDRRLVAKLVMFSVILISALCATLDQPFSKSCGFQESPANYFKSVSACACFIDRGCVYD